MNQPPLLIVLEPDQETAAFIRHELPDGYEIECVKTAAEAEAVIDSRLPDLFLCADDLNEESGLMFLARTRNKWPSLRRILMVPDPDGELFFTILREVPGLSYLSKPLEKKVFHRVIRHTLWEPVADADVELALTDSAPHPVQEESQSFSTTSVLVLETNPLEAARLITLLPWGFHHHLVSTPEQAEAALDRAGVDLFLCSNDLTSETGLRFLARTQKRWPATKRILLVKDLDDKFFFHASQEMPLLDYLTSPVNKRELLHLLRKQLHDHPFQDIAPEPPEKVEPDPAMPLQFIRIGTWALCLFIGAVIVVITLLITYAIKCRLSADSFSP